VTHQYVYAFSEGSGDMRSLLGGKGAGLAEMASLGLPVPDGFTVTTEACVVTSKAGGRWPEGLEQQVADAMTALEERTGLRFGDEHEPLLVSVRSGAAFSMPGMMDTILNLGLSDASVKGLAERSGNERFAYDAYRRLLQMFGEVVEGVDAHVFEDALTRLKAQRGVKQDVELDADDLKALVATFEELYEKGAGRPFPQDPREQLRRSISAVFASWDAPRAKVYRRANDIPDDLGTAVNLCQMVFGNMGDDSGTGVCFSRDPATGEHRLYGEFLLNAQGEDVVAGIRTPEPIERMRDVLPGAFDQLVETVERLEQHFRDVQDIEFTVERGTLYMLQTRTGKRTAAAAVRIARELVAEGVIDEDEAVRRVDPAQLDQLLHPRLDRSHEVEVLAKGLNASPGAAVGAAVFDADTAERRGSAGEDVILVRWETTPDDIHGLIQAQGVVTAHGGMTSHAAVVARGMGKPCVAGIEAAHIDGSARTLTIGDTVVHEGDVITIDGGTGELMLGAVPLVAADVGDDFRAIGAWADERRRLGVRANADTPEDAIRARELGAEGIGLCRTEHMFMAPDRLPVVREMILADDDAGRQAALDRLLPMQQTDFAGIFRAMAGLPVTIRLLDPPLHEFLPDRVELAVEVATMPEGEERRKRERLYARVRALAEQNPMLGTRGCRLGLVFPEIYEMQVRAIVRGALEAASDGEAAEVEIMIPLVAWAEELVRMHGLVLETVADELDRADAELPYHVGTMIELPRAALRAGELAETAEFFSFGTNDLTQTTMGLSRDDAENRFLATYLEDGVVERNPFQSIDEDGVGELVAIGCERGRAVREDLKLGVCGEHGGDPASISLFDRIGLDYVSCSPFRVPVARLAAAQAALAARGGAVAARDR
jgi:pyruvate,orthophosphate dikinase